MFLILKEQTHSFQISTQFQQDTLFLLEIINCRGNRRISFKYVKYR